MLTGIVRRLPVQVVTILLLLYTIEGYSWSTDSPARDIGSEVVTTHHAITLAGAQLAYTTRAGFISLRDKTTGEIHARIFFISYTVDSSLGSPVRPLTFYTSGGPGQPATLSDVAPRLVNGMKIVDNQDTWLGMTDLVLIDPVGSGYSRAVPAEYGGQYYNPDGDAESLAQFMQLYLQRYRWAAHQPIFIAGVSYGSIRSALIADIATRHDIPLQGLMLAASALGKQPDRNPYHLSNLAYIQLLPTFTATAFAHKKLAPDLQHNFGEALKQAEAWAANEYRNLLTQSYGLSSEQLEVAATQMARLTGLPPDVIRQHKFRIGPDEFLHELLGADWTPLGLSDSRYTKGDGLVSVVNPLTVYQIPSSLYIRGELHFRSDMPYKSGIFTMISGWHCDVNPGNCLDTQASAKLQSAMRANPSLQVLITSGYYDLNCPYFGTKLVISKFDPDLRARVNVVYYQAGHQIPPKYRMTVARFIESVLSSKNLIGQPR